MRLIDADELIKKTQEYIDEWNGWEDTRGGMRIIQEVIREMPTIEAEPVRHGKWINGACSECEERPVLKVIIIRGELTWERDGGMPDYCQGCGARMDADEISKIAKESADKIAEALENVRAKGWQKQNIEEDDKE